MAVRPATPRYATARIHTGSRLVTLGSDISAASPLAEMDIPGEVLQLWGDSTAN